MSKSAKADLDARLSGIQQPSDWIPGLPLRGAPE
jgi:hypothetical protein